MEKINRSDVTDGLRRQLKNSVGKKKQQFVLQQEERENESDDSEETKSQLLIKKKKYVNPIEKFRPKTKKDKQEKINKHKEAKVEIKEDPSKKNRFNQIESSTDVINEGINQLKETKTIQEKDIKEINDLKEEVIKESNNSEEELIKEKKEIQQPKKKYSKKSSPQLINDEITLFEDVEGNKKETNTRDIIETFSHESQQSNQHSEKHKNEKKPQKGGEEKKRKKTKTRSRMKNVKKDKRPDHLKPSYLQNTNSK
ncbi:hypothetical protein, conserved [Entamoeba dispar SAW760]|uniref:Uncharacterized protein n=1 Tax=Entamoeba dispar (strain ATCC PRA-260 / SAW760) TaxID=370354 RepID=B0EL45_ENTDS|nr:uncharacterized protein EDI_206810 [Entamoeba dispar SAW760]EDR24733.1 hypothetical protein, conserved [Entamoeba dispar SAW760]|eukprot:EDR24733.1 hypothetical protein, conserved [Entamoeba dispar SAW760]